MRRWMHILLIGVVTLGLSIDSASACRHWRRVCRPHCHRPVHCATVCRPVVHCSPVVVSHCGVTIVESAIVTPSPATPTETVISEKVIKREDDAVAKPPHTVEKPTETPPPAPMPIPQAVAPKEVPPLELPPAKPEPAPQPAREPPAAELKPLTPAPAEDLFPEEPKPAAEKPAPVVPPPVIEEPLEKPATKPVESEPFEAEPMPAKPKAKEKKEENLFDEFGADETAEEPLVPVGTEDAPKAAAIESEAEEVPAVAPAEPAVEPKPDSDDPFSGLDPAADEPMRKWVDDSGTHETFARLVEVSPRAARLLKASGTYATVPLERLSEHDRLYVSSATARLAAVRSAAPEATDTAGL